MVPALPPSVTRYTSWFYDVIRPTIAFEVAQKIKEVATSPTGKTAIKAAVGFGLGLYFQPKCKYLAERAVVQILGEPRATVIRLFDPFSNLTFSDLVTLSPLACVFIPLWEETFFRELLQGGLKNMLKSFYRAGGCSHSAADRAARVTAVFFTAVVFGLINFTPALIYGCHPFFFLPQVIEATLTGVLLGFAYEIGGMALPIGIHAGSNNSAWCQYARATLRGTHHFSFTIH